MVVLHRNFRKSMARSGIAAAFLSVGCVAKMLLFAFILMLLYQFIILHNFTLKPHSKIPMWYGSHSLFVPNCLNVTEPGTSKHENDICTKEFKRITSDMSAIRVPGLTVDDFERSIAHVGNRYRLARFAHKLVQSSSNSLVRSNQSIDGGGSPVSVVVCGGSISLGHGVTPNAARYSDQLEVWLNAAFPVSTGKSLKHQVFNRGSHGADVRFD
jgi:hypothetical protein